MTQFRHDNIDDIIRNFVYPIPLAGEGNIKALLGVLASENRRIDLDIESIYDDRFIGTASGLELDKIGEEVGATRQNGESDDALRRRIFGEFAAQSSDTTYDDFAKAVLNILDASPSGVELVTPPDSADKNIEVKIDGGYLDENPLSNEDIVSLLEQSNTTGASVTLSTTGTFAFDGDDTSLKGWNDGTWSDIIN